MRVFPPERGVMIRERSTGSYRVAAYFLAKSTSDVGSFTVTPFVLATIVYWSVGLRPEAVAFFFFLCLFLGQVRINTIEKIATFSNVFEKKQGKNNNYYKRRKLQDYVL